MFSGKTLDSLFKFFSGYTEEVPATPKKVEHSENYDLTNLDMDSFFSLGCFFAAYPHQTRFYKNTIYNLLTSEDGSLAHITLSHDVFRGQVGGMSYFEVLAEPSITQEPIGDIPFPLSCTQHQIESVFRCEEGGESVPCKNTLRVEASEIDPLNLSPEENPFLSAIIHQSYTKTGQPFYKQGLNRIELDDERSGHKTIVYLALSRSLLIRPCANNLDNPYDYHIEILGDVLGQGSYGVVSRSLGKFVRQQDGSLSLQPSRRVIKDEELGESCPLEDVLNEATLGRVLVGAKNPIVANVDGEVHAFIVEDYFDGKDLEKILNEDRNSSNKNEQLNVDQRCNIVQEVMFAAKKMHALGIIHRDIKPSNIIITLLSDNRVRAYIVDTNFAKRVNDESARERHGALIYAAPETLQLRCSDERSDNYSFGVTLANVFKGQLPGGLASKSDVLKLALTEFKLTGLFQDCDELDLQHRYILDCGIYGLKQPDSNERHSADDLIAIVDQIKLERKLATLPSSLHEELKHAYLSAVELRSIIGSSLQEALISIQGMYQQPLFNQSSGSIQSYLMHMEDLRRVMVHKTSNLHADTRILSAFIEASRIQVLHGLTAKEEIIEVVNAVMDAYINTLGQFNDLIIRIKMLMEHTGSQLGLHPLLEVIAENLMKCSNHAFDFDDVVILAKKFNKSVLRIDAQLEKVESELMQASLGNCASEKDGEPSESSYYVAKLG